MKNDNFQSRNILTILLVTISLFGQNYSSKYYIKPKSKNFSVSKDIDTIITSQLNDKENEDITLSLNYK